MITRGIHALPEDVRADILSGVQAFTAFTPDNDPYGEHDFGSFYHGHAGRIFWKIDYYDTGGLYGSPDPADARLTHRVLTIMLALEY